MLLAKRSNRLPLLLLLLGGGCGCGVGYQRSDGSQPASPAASGSAAAASASAKPGGSARGRELETYMVLLDVGVYKTKVAPAFDKYVESGDVTAVRDLAPSGGAPPLPESKDRKTRLEAALKLAPAVVEAKCLVHLPGIEPYQLGGNSALVSYLYSASDWLRETLTSKDISDITWDYPLGEHTEIIRPSDAAEIRVYTRNIVQPEDAAIKTQLAALLTMMEAPSRNPNYALALVMR